MSLILEALRKSEAERRLGNAPDVLTAMPVLRTPAPRQRWTLWIAGICMPIAVLVLGWWWVHPIPTTQPPMQPLVKQSTQAVPNVDASTAISIAGDAPQASTDSRKPQAPPTITLPMTSASPSVAPIPGTAVPTVVASSLPQARESMPPHALVNGTTPVHPIAPVAIQPAPPTIAPTLATPAPVPAMPAPHTADEPALLSLGDLSADERNGLPALKVSMHVYADDPAHRFMIVDGQRVSEGARIADGVILVRIRRDGAELDVHGRRLLLPKP